jgi:ABC-type glycerol-3-phosphate transport system substrate-binding protein
MSILQGMTESLFAETLKRIAEDVWQKKFKEAAEQIKHNTNYYPGYNKNVVQEMITNAFLECLKNDSELKQALQDAIGHAAREYFQLKLK